jgi:hypothetical protein
MHGTHAADRLVRGQGVARRWHSRILLLKKRRWESNPLRTALQAVASPSGSSAILVSAPPRNRTPSCRFVICRAIRHTRRASVSTRNRTWIWTFGGSNAIHYTIETHAQSVPTWSRTRTRALGEPCAIRYTIGTRLLQGRRLDLHQHDAVYRTAASLFGHVGFFSARARGFEPGTMRSMVGTALETVCSPRSTLVSYSSRSA